MTKTTGLYEFGEFRLDVEHNLLLHRGEVVSLAHKALETLIILVENNGQIVEKDTLIERVWHDTFVEEGSLTRNISTLRKVFGEEPGSNKYIETIPRRGYRFVARVTDITSDNSQEEPAPFFAQSNGENKNGSAAPHCQKFSEKRWEAGRAWAAHESALRGNNDEIQSPPFRTRQKFIFLSLVAFFSLAAVISLLILPGWLNRSQSRETPGDKQELSFENLTNIGKAREAAISPDGKYVVYVADDIDRQSLWVRQIATGSSVQIAEPAEVTYQGLAFSSDSNFIYFNLWDRKNVGAIYRIPTLGGVSKKVINDCMPSVSVSPDGKKIAFVRGSAVRNDQSLMVAETDGSAEQYVSRSQNWIGYTTWSPGGDKIAFAIGVFVPQEQSYVSIHEVSLESGQERELSTQRWLGVSGLAWARNGKELILNGAEKSRQPFQLWKLNYSTGEARKVTNNPNGFYEASSLTSDDDTMVAVQEDAYSNIWTAPASDLGKPVKITAGKYEGFSFSWTPDNRIVYNSNTNGNLNTWIMNQDGSNKKQLTSEKESEFGPSVTSDGAYILFSSNRTGTGHVWRMDIDGKNLKQLTDKDGGWGPVASPSGNWLVYFSGKNGGKENLWKMSIDGENPVRLTSLSSYNPAISPDGKMLAYSIWNENAKPEHFEHEIISLETGQKIRSFELPSTAFRGSGNTLLRWMPDSSGLTFIDNQNGASNISFIPLAGGRPKRLTNFTDGLIFWFDWSRDGRQIAMSRGVLLNDAVLIKNLQNFQR